MTLEDSNPDSPLPVSLTKTEDRCLVIKWNDDVEQKLPFRKLRDSCRCANCIDKRMESLKETNEGQAKLSNELPILTMAEARPLDIVQMHPVGNYAYNIHFSDGHSAGIFTFELLRSIEN
ncbi:MAG: DUF971 family protein [Mariniblastus sp.]|jgi:DUF971 family protein